MGKVFVIRIIVMALLGMICMFDPVYASFRCPMHWDLTCSDKPGKCPKCGMDLVNTEGDRPSDGMDGTELESVEFDFSPLISTNSQTAKGNAPVSKNEAAKTKRSDSPVEYRCPMHHAVVSDKPGNCSKCGMKLKKVLNPPVKNRN